MLKGFYLRGGFRSPFYLYLIILIRDIYTCLSVFIILSINGFSYVKASRNTSGKVPELIVLNVANNVLYLTWVQYNKINISLKNKSIAIKVLNLQYRIIIFNQLSLCSPRLKSQRFIVWQMISAKNLHCSRKNIWLKTGK